MVQGMAFGVRGKGHAEIFPLGCCPGCSIQRANYACSRAADRERDGERHWRRCNRCELSHSFPNSWHAAAVVSPAAIVLHDGCYVRESLPHEEDVFRAQYGSDFTARCYRLSSRLFNRKPKMFQFIPFATPWPSPAISGLVTRLATASRRITNEDYERLALLKGIREAPRDQL